MAETRVPLGRLKDKYRELVEGLSSAVAGTVNAVAFAAALVGKGGSQTTGGSVILPDGAYTIGAVVLPYGPVSYNFGSRYGATLTMGDSDATMFTMGDTSSSPGFAFEGGTFYGKGEASGTAETFFKGRSNGSNRAMSFRNMEVRDWSGNGFDLSDTFNVAFHDFHLRNIGGSAGYGVKLSHATFSGNSATTGALFMNGYISGSHIGIGSPDTDLARWVTIINTIFETNDYPVVFRDSADVVFLNCYFEANTHPAEVDRGIVIGGANVRTEVTITDRYIWMDETQFKVGNSLAEAFRVNQAVAEGSRVTSFQGKTADADPFRIVQDGTPPSAASGVMLDLVNAGATSSNAYLSINSGNAATAGIRLGDNDAAGRGRVYYDNSLEAILLGAAAINRVGITATSLYSVTNNQLSLGNSSVRWSEAFVTNGTINTSDERIKTDIEDIEGRVLDAWAQVEWQSFKMKASVADKGELARIHFGAIVQRIIAAFEAHGLNPMAYAPICHDVWAATYEPLRETYTSPRFTEEMEEDRDENGRRIYRAVQVPVIGADGEQQTYEAERTVSDGDGNPVMVEVNPAGDLYSLRYTECLALEAAMLRRKLDRQEFRIARLEANFKKMGDDAS